MTNWFNVSRPMTGGWNGTGSQTVWQTKTVSGATPTAPSGGTVQVNSTATAAADWGTNIQSGFTTLPATFTDHYGGFPH